jgi:predicted ATPase
LIDRFVEMKNTQWCVITGPPCSGKTTLIDKLEALGYPVVHEVARWVIEGNIKGDMTTDQRQTEKLNLQQVILDTKLDIENRIPEDQLTFFDRGIPDSIAYFELVGLDPQPVISSARRRRYRQVFFLESVPYIQDPVRTEQRRAASALTDALVHSYRLTGYTPILIPNMNTEKRLERILAQI